MLYPADPSAAQTPSDDKDIRNTAIRQRIDWLFDCARRHSEEFQRPEAQLARSHYIEEHPTAIVVFTCMDGRVNITAATNTLDGIILPLRNLDGRFNLGWPHLGRVLEKLMRGLANQRRPILVLVIYHYSKGDPRRGCDGFSYDTYVARTHMYGIKRQIEAVFDTDHWTVFPLVCGFETDEDTLVLHGSSGDVLDLSTISSTDQEILPTLLTQLYPNMPDLMRQDLLPLVRGNIAHIASIKPASRNLVIEHREWMICIGRGFDWLHMPNQALIIGPYSPDLVDPIRKAAGIIDANMRAGHIPDDGFLLLAEETYQETGVNRTNAELKARFLSGFAANIIRIDFSKLAEKMHVHTTVLNRQSRAMEMIDGSGGYTSKVD
jgi:hypothetical protein